jgi:hypothetical protein
MFNNFNRDLNEKSFKPCLLGLFSNSFYFPRKGLYKHIVELGPKIGGSILDVGCGSKPYRIFFRKPVISINILEEIF